MNVLFVIIALFSFNVTSSELTEAIKASLETNDTETLKPDLLKIEFFFQSSKIKNQHTVFMTEFINYSLKNPINREYNRYPLKKETIVDEENTILEKSKQFSPIAKLLAEKIILEIKVLRQRRDFNSFLERIKKSYYFTSKELKLIDKKMRFIEPWWRFYLQTSPKDINHLFTTHIKRFIVHFGKATSFILNTNINIASNKELSIFGSPKKNKDKITIEQKLENLIKNTQSESKSADQANLKINQDKIIQSWIPKDDQVEQKEVFKNLNGPKSYPKPSPNYVAPDALPIPMNDW